MDREKIQKYAFIPLSIALVVSVFGGMQPDMTHYCEAEETKRFCFELSDGAGTRCYLNQEKTSWDYCKTGWKELVYVKDDKPFIPDNVIIKDGRDWVCEGKLHDSVCRFGSRMSTYGELI